MNRKLKERSVGAITVEVALCLPILLTVLFGSYELARANMMLHSTESAAYEGARVGIIPGATPEAVRAAVERVLLSTNVRTFEVDINPAVITNEDEQIEVVVTVPMRENLAIPAFFIQDPTFRGTCTLQREQL